MHLNDTHQYFKIDCKILTRMFHHRDPSNFLGFAQLDNGGKTVFTEH